MRQIVALGGGGFSDEVNNTLLDDYILGLTKKATPRICFLGTASGDGSAYLEKFYAAFQPPRAEPSHVAVFHGPAFDPFPETLVNLGPDLRGHLLTQDVVYVGGGNTAALLAVWRAHGLNHLLQEACDAGIVLCGLSAGSLCWFESGVSDADGHGMAPLLNGLGFLPGSHCPHFDSEPGRRPTYHSLVAAGTLPAGYAADDCAGLHFIDGRFAQAVASRPGARAYRVERAGSWIAETPIEPLLLRA